MSETDPTPSQAAFADSLYHFATALVCIGEGDVRGCAVHGKAASMLATAAVMLGSAERVFGVDTVLAIVAAQEKP
jgi:hypothetical protein